MEEGKGRERGGREERRKGGAETSLRSIELTNSLRISEGHTSSLNSQTTSG